MNDQPPSGDRAAETPEIDPTAAHTARVYDYLLGGVTNFEVDRQAARAAGAAVGGIEVAKASVRSNRVFLGQAIRYLAAEAGIRQFLDIGTGIPNDDNVHAVALDVAPESHGQPLLQRRPAPLLDAARPLGRAVSSRWRSSAARRAPADPPISIDAALIAFLYGMGRMFEVRLWAAAGGVAFVVASSQLRGPLRPLRLRPQQRPRPR